MAVRKKAPAPDVTQNHDDADADADYSPPPHVEQPGERRAVHIITRMEAVQADREKSIDGKALIGDLPMLSQRYLALVLTNGPIANPAAAKTLKTTEKELEPAIIALDRVLEELTSDED